MDAYLLDASKNSDTDIMTKAFRKEKIIAGGYIEIPRSTESATD
jgi:hypothetical protein